MCTTAVHNTAQNDSNDLIVQTIITVQMLSTAGKLTAEQNFHFTKTHTARSTTMDHIHTLVL